MASVAKREWTSPTGKAMSAWVVRYKDGDKHRSRQFEKKKDADVFRQKVEREITESRHIAQSEARTVREVCELYIRHTEARVADGLIGQARQHDVRTAVDKHIAKGIGHILIKDLTWNQVHDFYTRMREVGISARTLKKYADILRLIEDFAFKRGLTKQQVVTVANRELRGIPRAKVRTFKVADIEKLLVGIEDRQYRRKHHVHLMTKCVVHLAAFCGLRFGEIMGLTWGCIDFTRRVLLIRHSLSRWNELKGPKTRAGIRDVPLPEHIVGLLQEWRKRYSVENDRDLVFVMASGRSMEPSEFHANVWKPALKQAGLWKPGEDAFHFHALRHFAASAFVDMGMSLPRVAATLGHSTFDMTLQVYAHEIRGGDRQHDVVDGLAGRLLPSPSVAHGLRTGTQAIENKGA